MLELVAPLRNPEEDYDTAVDHRMKETADLLRGNRNHVINRYAEFEKSRITPIVPEQFDPKCAHSHALRSNYDLTYAGKPLADLRESVFGAAAHGLCALCGRTSASTIDHFLPKQWFPEYSIFHLNLIPCCDPCNRTKGEKVGNEEANFIYPYGTQETDIPLLNCNVNSSQSVVLFDFDANDNLPESIKRSVRYHLIELGLSEAYSAAAQLEIAENASLFVEAFELDGPVGVLAEIKKRIRSISRKFDNSYWKLSMYRGLADSSDFLRNPKVASVD